MPFSKPIDWKPEDRDTTLESVSGNGLKITRKAGPLGLTAFDNGFVVYRPGSSPDTGNLELVLFPNKWPQEMKKFFNPSHPKAAFNSGLTELPPGRVVYRDIAKSVIKRDLTTLLHARFVEWLRDETKVVPSMEFIPDYGHAFAPLKFILKFAKPEEVDQQIGVALDFVFDKSSQNTLYQGLPVQAGDLLANIGDAASPAAVTLEIRDLYGEPINPRFYLTKLQPIAADILAPVPPFTAGEEPLARLKDPTDKFLPIRIPMHGGVEFSLIKNGDGSYESPLIWDYQYDSAKSTFTTTVSARPGHTVTPPNRVDASRVNSIWDQDNVDINKYAEFFSCPCELILATIFKEGSVYNTNKGDTHSIRFEEIPSSLEGKYAQDYEELLKKGGSITKGAVDAFAQLAGGWITEPNEFTYGPIRELDPPKNAKLEASALFDPTDAVGSSPSRRNITWGQVEEIWAAKPGLITIGEMVLPPLGKKVGKDRARTVTYDYKLIADDASLGPTVADVYLNAVGGEKSAADPLTTRPEVKRNDYKLPLKKNKDERGLTAALDPTNVVTWEKLLKVLAKMSANDAKNIPKANWALKPLQKQDKVDLHKTFTLPKLTRLLSLPPDGENAAALLVLNRYRKLQTIDLKYTSNLGDPAPAGADGVRAAQNPQDADYFTMREARAMSQIYPDKISIGIGQLLLETGFRRVIPFVKKNYPTLFTGMGLGDPTGGFSALVDWMWANLWDKRELQIALIAAYHKQNATIYWEGEQFNKNPYKIGELMTKFDFPRVAGAYNSGHVQKQFKNNDDKDWGMHTSGDYMVKYWSAVMAAVAYFDTFTPPNGKSARVRLRPDLETDSGMDVR